jgi:hypothetical protein
VSRLPAEIVWLLLFGTDSQPLIKAVCGNQAAAFHGVPEGGLSAAVSDIPVDALESDGRVFGPIGDQPPTDQTKSALRFLGVLTDDRNRLRRSNVPTWRPRQILVETKMVAEVALLRSEAVSSAQGVSV